MAVAAHAKTVLGLWGSTRPTGLLKRRTHGRAPGGDLEYRQPLLCSLRSTLFRLLPPAYARLATLAAYHRHTVLDKPAEDPAVADNTLRVAMQKRAGVGRDSADNKHNELAGGSHASFSRRLLSSAGWRICSFCRGHVSPAGGIIGADRAPRSSSDLGPLVRAGGENERSRLRPARLPASKRHRPAGATAILPKRGN